jgi:hypothetical protein
MRSTKIHFNITFPSIPRSSTCSFLFSTSDYNRIKIYVNAFLIWSEDSSVGIATDYIFFFIWFVRLLALRPLLAYCASLG